MSVIKHSTIQHRAALLTLLPFIAFSCAKELPFGEESAPSASGPVKVTAEGAPVTEAFKSGSFTTDDGLFVNVSATPLELTSMTKGTIATSLSSMKMSVYKYSKASGASSVTTPYIFNQSPTQEGSVWQPMDGSLPLEWPQYTDAGLRFFAFAPERSNSTYGTKAFTGTASTSGVPSLSATLADNPRYQDDLLVSDKALSYGDAGWGTSVNMTFTHALSAIRFVSGDRFLPMTVKSITVGGLKVSGTYSFATKSWTPSGSNAKRTLSVNAVMDGDAGDPIGSGDLATMFVIPQSTASMTLSLVVEIDGVEHNVTASKAVSNALTQFVPGYLYTFTVALSEDSLLEWEYTFGVTALDGLEYPNDGDMKEFEVESYRTSRITGSVEPVQYSVNFVNVANNPLTVEGGTGSRAGGQSSVVDVTCAAAAITETLQSPKAWPTDATHTTALGSSANPVDLSLLDIHGNALAGGQSTANCYVVHAPGTYMIPAVYGNAIANGQDNLYAYWSPETGDPASDGYIKQFEGISSSITGPSVSEFSSSYRGLLIWEDRNGLITVDPTPITRTVNGRSLNYIKFTVNSNNIGYGNAMIGLENSATTSGGGVAWSYHIWVTADDLTPKAVRKGSGSSTMTLLPQDLGEVPSQMLLSAAARTGMTLRFTGTTDGTNSVNRDFSLSRAAYSGTRIAKAHHSTLYQWGRPGAFPGVSGASYKTNVYVFAPSVGEQAGLDYSVRFPYKFYKGNNGSDWCNARSYYLCNLWDNGFDQSLHLKTVYDPSPVGYYVPNTITSEFSSPVSKDSDGFTYNDSSSQPVHFWHTGGILASAQTTGASSLSYNSSMTYWYQSYGEGETEGWSYNGTTYDDSYFGTPNNAGKIRCTPLSPTFPSSFSINNAVIKFSGATYGSANAVSRTFTSLPSWKLTITRVNDTFPSGRLSCTFPDDGTLMIYPTAENESSSIYSCTVRISNPWTSSVDVVVKQFPKTDYVVDE